MEKKYRTYSWMLHQAPRAAAHCVTMSMQRPEKVNPCHEQIVLQYRTLLTLQSSADYWELSVHSKLMKHSDCTACQYRTHKRDQTTRLQHGFAGANSVPNGMLGAVSSRVTNH